MLTELQINSIIGKTIKDISNNKYCMIISFTDNSCIVVHHKSTLQTILDWLWK